jgi:WD40 repeat protein
MRALDGHLKEVRGVAFLPDGRLVSVGADKTARLWQPDGTGTVIHTGKGPLYALDVSPDGKTIAVSGRHNAPGTPITLYDVAAAGRAICTLSWEVGVIVWSSTGSGVTEYLESGPRSVWSLSFSAGGRSLAAAVRKPGAANIPNGGGGYLWPLVAEGSGTSLPDSDAYAVRFSPTEDLLAVTARQRVVFYDADGVSERFTYPVQCDWAPAVTFLPSDGRCVIAAGSYVHLVDPSGNRKPVKVKSESRIVTAVAPTPDGRGLLVGGKPGRVEVFDLTGPAPARRTAFDFAVGGVHGLAVAPDGLTFAVAGEKGLLVCDVDAG